MTRGLGRVRGRLALVTGAASGIGRATAGLLAARGARLALWDLDAATLDVAPAAVVQSERLDVARADEVDHGARELVREHGAPDLVVNAAGVLVLGSVLDTLPDDWQHVLGANLLGPANVCRALAPSMIGRGSGHFVNVASASAFATPSELGAYGATKHALVGLSQALRDELAPHGIGVSVVCPGFVNTPIVERARILGSNVEEQRRSAVELLRSRMAPERVAERIVRAAERGMPLVPVGFEAHLLDVLARISPLRASAVFGLVRRLRSRT